MKDSNVDLLTKVPTYLGLIHYPVLDRKGEEITTSVTNMDVHDISRTCKTFGLKEFAIVTPIEAQHALVGRILGHWRGDRSNPAMTHFHPDRPNALSCAKLYHSFEEVLASIREREGKDPAIVFTAAKQQGEILAEKQLLERLAIDNRPLFLLFGTGWGLSKTLRDQAHYHLPPIEGVDSDYNHLSVRSAVAIYCDRLFGHHL